VLPARRLLLRPVVAAVDVDRGVIRAHEQNAGVVTAPSMVPRDGDLHNRGSVGRMNPLEHLGMEESIQHY
jgi:hypothetical protein